MNLPCLGDAVDDIRLGLEKLKTKRIRFTGRSFQTTPSQDRTDGLQAARRNSGRGNPIDSVVVTEAKGSLQWRRVASAECPDDEAADRTQRRQHQSASSFKQSYCARNVPCIISGLENICFRVVSSQWRCKSGGAKGSVNADWFRLNVGDETLVPVRIDAETSDCLDAEGRAEECATKEMKLVDWIEDCARGSQGTGYLKDWHLVQFLKSKSDSSKWSLYTTPDIFERDILNSFLERYCGSDYKFVYWGPSGSRTKLHSDVLHSFSWSYNVVGRKKWTFYTPDEGRSFTVIQEAGECIFVPSLWMHEVENLVDTLSINHNWVTSANIDLTWECLQSEMSSIEKELMAWGLPEDDLESREMMLQGCCGLNVTMLCLMILLELVELLNTLADEAVRDSSKEESDCFSIFRLEGVLRSVLDEGSTIARLGAVLKSDNLAHDIVRCAEEAMKHIQGRA